MATQWQSDEWGAFKWDMDAWVATQPLPTKRFGLRGEQHLTFELAFQTDDENKTPSPAAFQCAEGILADPDWLVELITTALFDDFQGDGPGSGMWWDGDIDAVEEILGVDIPEEPQQLAALLYLTRILIRENHRLEIDGPLAVISFGAAFEEEHGVEFLSDGQEVYGIGYTADAQPFGL